MRAFTIKTTPRAAAVASLALLGLATGLFATPADARLHHRRHYRPLLVQASGLTPGTYPADYATSGYGCRTSILAGNFGGCGYGWAYEGGPGWGNR